MLGGVGNGVKLTPASQKKPLSKSTALLGLKQSYINWNLNWLIFWLIYNLPVRVTSVQLSLHRWIGYIIQLYKTQHFAWFVSEKEKQKREKE